MSHEPWSREEVEATVSDYLAMLTEFHSGTRLNKAAHNRALQRQLSERSIKAIEFKHQNISAVLSEAGLDYLDGYYPAYNYQELLKEVVVAQLGERPDVRDLLSRVVGEESVSEPQAVQELPLEVPVPRRVRKVVSERYERPRRPRKVEWDLIEARNRSLGLAGELAILEVEARRLWRAGKRALSRRVEHVSRTKGDGLGYDISSFELDGKERLIEVKTTRRAQLTPFAVTSTELSASRGQADCYRLFRVFRFERDPQFFVLRGAIDRACRIYAATYTAELA